LAQARILLAQADELQNAGSEISKRIAGPLEIGCLATLYPLAIPELLYLFKQRHAQARVNALAGDQTELFESLRSGQICMALSYEMNLPLDMEFTALGVLAPYVYVAVGHRLAGRGTIGLAEIADEPFILLDLPMSRDYFLGLFAQAKVSPNIAGRFGHFDVIRSLVARGEGFSIANAQPKNQSSLDGRALAYLQLEPELKALVYGIVMLKGARRSPTQNAFVELCGELLAGKNLPGTV
jgi:DNA-binding transcriptional LysR family regulator